MSASAPTERALTPRPTRSLRDRARRAMQVEVEMVAFGLFVEQGFEQTTIEQINTKAGISRSTFFRYFPTKEDLVVGSLAEWGLDILNALEERPEDEPVWLALRNAIQPVIAATTSDPDTTRLMTKMLYDTPSLAARRFEQTLKWRTLLIPEVARRLGLSPTDQTDPRPQAMVSGMLGSLDAATNAWSDPDTDCDLKTLLKRAMDSLHE